MTTAPVEELIYEWLNARYPNGPVWFDEDMPADRLPPLETRMLYAFNVIEYNISNGGWSQFLWNCLPNWRSILETAQKGYRLIGANEQADTLETLRSLCEQDESECLAAIERNDGSMNTFAEFTRRSYRNTYSDWQSLFWGDIYERRTAWLNENEERLRSLIGRNDS
ncbi:protein of unknown function [Solimonas aquatica]|uniref:DNA mimic protein DMP19 C-terminal domain-containing protein n=1 Tax=Solimonas aquatica TaxID=489703 RepID=A0A1H9MNG2_9GAMM|nr:DUF4375 domain-containing protein [Solimonas aquatica]SER25007.1 protein of unknown function [Solimonas aquatica]